MNWPSLYSAQRTGDPPRKDANPDAVRTSYIRDYDRIIFSSAFRRLQNKTQVFPLPGPVFVHNRLTHSLEVASVGRSLGKAVGDALADTYSGWSEGCREFYKYELASVVAAACLAHDIGNPPFGHSGEDAIRTFFTGLEGSQRSALHDALSPNQLKDFELFEGNANAFRILTHSFNEPQPGGYKLTYATLAAIIKYPCCSAEGFSKKKTGLIATKKSGFFDTEVATYRQIAETLGLLKQEGFGSVYARHPFVYLVEAADDICYRVIDLEDAHRLHIVSLATFGELFLPFFEREEGYNSLAYVKGKLAQINDPNQQVQFIRAKWIGLMIEKMKDQFLRHEASLLAGTLQTGLMDGLDERDQELMKKISDYSVKHVYGYKAVLEIEVAGYHVIGGLLQEFVTAVLQPKTSKAEKLLQLVSPQFPVTGKGLYGDVQSVVDFISGMTDLYAMDLYRKITGISIPQFG